MMKIWIPVLIPIIFVEWKMAALGSVYPVFIQFYLFLFFSINFISSLVDFVQLFKEEWKMGKKRQWQVVKECNNEG